MKGRGLGGTFRPSSMTGLVGLHYFSAATLRPLGWTVIFAPCSDPPSPRPFTPPLTRSPPPPADGLAVGRPANARTRVIGHGRNARNHNRFRVP